VRIVRIGFSSDGASQTPTARIGHASGKSGALEVRVTSDDPMPANGRFCCLDKHNGRLTGRYRHRECTGMEKARRISSQFDLSRYPEVYAYGDTSEDLEMLALAHR